MISAIIVSRSVVEINDLRISSDFARLAPVAASLGHQPEGDVLPNWQAVEQCRRLKQHPDLTVDPLALVRTHGRDFNANDLDRAAVRRQQYLDTLDGDRLASAGTTDDYDRFADADVEIAPARTFFGPNALCTLRSLILSGVSAIIAGSLGEEGLG